jgi:2-polyprenyl-3-methyl-5-hydroxy-6-metoxy-1,4-benzoquinol methylase
MSLFMPSKTTGGLLGRMTSLVQMPPEVARSRHPFATLLTGWRRLCSRLRHAVLPVRMPAQKRFLSGQPRRTEAFLQGAKNYVGNLDPFAHDYLFQKPTGFSTAAHTAFFSEMYQVLNLLKAMAVPPGGRILEVGSGPGWVTETLVTLGYEVDAIEPSEDMIGIARERVASRVRHHHLQNPPRATFHCVTLEECLLPDASFDAILFHAALHHVIDEEKGIAQCFRMLKPGGVLGVSEAAWRPGDRTQEAGFEAEMARFGTLENPFTRSYLDFLLATHGFREVQRYHGVNGLYPVEMGHVSLAAAAQAPARTSNTLTARKPTAAAEPGAAAPRAAA